MFKPAPHLWTQEGFSHVIVLRDKRKYLVGHVCEVKSVTPTKGLWSVVPIKGHVAYEVPEDNLRVVYHYTAAVKELVADENDPPLHKETFYATHPWALDYLCKLMAWSGGPDTARGILVEEKPKTKSVLYTHDEQGVTAEFASLFARFTSWKDRQSALLQEPAG